MVVRVGVKVDVFDVGRGGDVATGVIWAFIVGNVTGRLIVSCGRGEVVIAISLFFEKIEQGRSQLGFFTGRSNIVRVTLQA